MTRRSSPAQAPLPARHRHLAVVVVYGWFIAMQAGACASSAPGSSGSVPPASLASAAPPASEAPSSSSQSSFLLAPYAVATDAGMFTQISPSVWHVPAGTAVSSFMGRNGPPAITAYNWNKVKVSVDEVLATLVPVVPAGKKQARHDAADRVQLTACGLARAAIPAQASKVVYQLEYACTGRAHGVGVANDATNCARACGGVGACRAGCVLGSRSHHSCTVRLRIEATVALAAARTMRVSLRSAHVGADGEVRHTPVGVEAVTPPPFGLRADPAIKRELVHRAQGKDTATDVVSSLGTELRVQDELQPGAQLNSRYFPKTDVISGVLERAARAARGDGTSGDWDRLNDLAARVLIPRGVVIYFEPFVVMPDGSVHGIIVIATEWSLRLGTNAKLAATDAKHDTSAGRAYYSSIRVPTPFRHQPVSGWLSPQENVVTLTTAMQSTADCVPCSNKACPHTWHVVWKRGNYRRYRACEERAFFGDMACDKHMPTLRAILLAGFLRALLDRFHGFKCHNERLKTLSILEGPAAELGWAFRLYTRSCDDAQADKMRALVVQHVLQRVLDDSAPWSFEQARDYIGYFDSCWHQPALIRDAWIEGGRLHLAEGVVPATGGMERHHRAIDETQFKCQLNRDVTSVAVNMAGYDCSGNVVNGIFATAEQEYEREASTQKPRAPPMDISIRISRAKACYQLLRHGRSGFEACPNDSAYVCAFAEDVVRRHAEPSARDATPFPKQLQHMREALSYGGAGSFEKPGWLASNHRYACECLRSTYHGAHSAFGFCKHAEYRKLCERVLAAPDAAAAERVYAEAEATLRALVWGREKSKPESVRCWALYEAADPKGDGTRAELLDALAAEPSVPPTGKGTGLTAADEAALLWRAADDAADQCRVCQFADPANLGLVFDQSAEGDVVMLGCKALKDGRPGPAEHSGARIAPGAHIWSAETSLGVEELEVTPSGELLLRGNGPLLLRFSPQSLALVADAAAAADVTEVSSGRSAKRRAKFPSDPSKAQRGPQAGGAPARRGRKPQTTRAEDRRASVEVLPATSETTERVADLQRKLLDAEAMRATYCEIGEQFASYIP